jgi:hypothetical protein
MRFMIWSVAGGLLLVGAVWSVGWLLPPGREGRAEVVIDVAPARVLEVIEAVALQPEWRAGIATVMPRPDGWTEVTARGGRITFVAGQADESQVRLSFSSDAGYAGTWDATLTAEGKGTRIAVVERAEVPSPLGRILARIFFDPDAFAADYLAALKARSEGE